MQPNYVITCNYVFAHNFKFQLFWDAMEYWTSFVQFFALKLIYMEFYNQWLNQWGMRVNHAEVTFFLRSHKCNTEIVNIHLYMYT